MRWFHTTVVAALAIIVLAFAIQNFQSTTISLLNLRLSAPLAVIVVVVYLLGMLTGGSVVSLIRWAVTEPGKR
jgi:putative membrane protein